MIFGSKLLKGGKFVLREAFSDICEVSVGVFKALYHEIFDATLEEVIFLKFHQQSKSANIIIFFLIQAFTSLLLKTFGSIFFCFWKTSVC